MSRISSWKATEPHLAGPRRDGLSYKKLGCVPISEPSPLTLKPNLSLILPLGHWLQNASVVQ